MLLYFCRYYYYISTDTVATTTPINTVISIGIDTVTTTSTTATIIIGSAAAADTVNISTITPTITLPPLSATPLIIKMPVSRHFRLSAARPEDGLLLDQIIH